VAIDSTVEGVSSNAYCDVAYADAYHGDRLHSPEWAAGSTLEKEAALIWATRIIDNLTWKSIRATQAQALRWPQMDAYDRDGWPVPVTVIPKTVKDAAAEYAWYLLKEDRTVDGGSATIKALSVGPISLTFDENAKAKQIPDAVLSMLGAFLGSGNGVSMGLLRA